MYQAPVFHRHIFLLDQATLSYQICVPSGCLEPSLVTFSLQSTVFNPFIVLTASLYPSFPPKKLSISLSVDVKTNTIFQQQPHLCQNRRQQSLPMQTRCSVKPPMCCACPVARELRREHTRRRPRSTTPTFLLELRPHGPAAQPGKVNPTTAQWINVARMNREGG